MTTSKIGELKNEVDKLQKAYEKNFLLYYLIGRYEAKPEKEYNIFKEALLDGLRTLDGK